MHYGHPAGDMAEGYSQLLLLGYGLHELHILSITDFSPDHDLVCLRFCYTKAGSLRDRHRGESSTLTFPGLEQIVLYKVRNRARWVEVLGGESTLLELRSRDRERTDWYNVD